MPGRRTTVRLVLDSTFVIDHLLGQAAAVRRLRDIFEDGDDPIVTEIVVCEVRTGLRPEAEDHLARFLEPMEFVQPGEEVAMTAGRWRADLRRQGRALSHGDALIGASAHALGATVLTRNAKDFALMPVPVEVY
jgi:predicted nucleic acid-binding protein